MERLLDEEARTASIYQKISDDIGAISNAISAQEVADIANRLNLSDGVLRSLGLFTGSLAERRHRQIVEANLRESRLLMQAPKTFEDFDFGRIAGTDIEALKNLPTLSHLEAHINIALIGPEGVGKTHLAQAFGSACCIHGHKTYFTKATELRDKLVKAYQRDKTASAVKSLVRPACLIIDELGRCNFDRRCTDLLFDIIDRRYEKQGPNSVVITSNVRPQYWGEFFEGEKTALCILDRIFDRASVFIIEGSSFRGQERRTHMLKCMPKPVQTSVR